jgi:hypothetical protein
MPQPSDHPIQPVTLTGQHVQLVPLSLDHCDELVAAVQAGPLGLWQRPVAPRGGRPGQGTRPGSVGSERRCEHGLRRICEPEFKHEVPKKPRCLALNAPPRGALAACHALGGLQSSLGSGRDQPPQHYRALEC